MTCENLATKADVAAIGNRIDALNARLQSIEELLNRILIIASAIPGSLADLKRITSDLGRAINDTKIALLTAFGITSETIIDAVNAVENIVLAGINSAKDGVIAAIAALRDVLITLIKGLFGLRDEEAIDYNRIEAAINSAHVSTRTIILRSIGDGVAFLADQIKGVATNYDRIDAIVGKHHTSTRVYIAGLVNEIIEAINRSRNSVDLSEVLNKLDRLESLIKAGIGSILALLNTIWAFLQAWGNNPNNNDAKFDYQRIEKAIAGAHLTTRSLILGAINGSTEYLASLILNIKAAVDYERIRKAVNDAAAGIQNNINNNSRANVDYARIAEIVNGASGEIRGFTANVTSVYGNAILRAIGNIKNSIGSSGDSKLIQRIYQVLGCDDYPVNVPSSLITAEGKTNTVKQIPTITQLLAWFVQRLDELIGQWEVGIEIKDTDPTTPGDQPQKIKLPNIAEAMGELFILAFQSYINTETLLNIGVRNLTESAMDKQQNFVTYKLLQSLTDWVGFKQKDIVLDLPLTFTLNKTRYDEILVESTAKVHCVEFDDKVGLEADLMRFREMKAAIDAQFKRKINPYSDIKQQVLDYLLHTYRTTEKINKDDEGFKEFIHQVETGFTDIPSAGDPTKPYGRPFNERPRVRDLTQLDENK